jgi:hypothetical protein
MSAVQRKRVHHSTQLLVGGMFVVVVALVGFGWSMGRASYDIFGAVLIAPALVLLTIPMAFRTAHRENDSALTRIVVIGLLLKLAGSLFRFYVAYNLYGGNADAYTYHLQGRILATAIHHGHWAVPQAPFGTQFLIAVTGITYAVVGPTKLGGFFLFSWFGFVGQILFYRAFRIGFPEGDHRRYAKLIFFLPSLIFWPSSLGKEAWMTLALGVTALGAARILARRRGGFVWLALGLWGAGAVRPHIPLIVAAAAVVAYPFRRTRDGSLGNAAAKLFGLAVLLVISLVLMGRAASFFGVQSLDAKSVGAVLNRTQTQTSLGGSAFHAARVRSPLDLPWAAVTVLFRPFPTEVHNSQALLSAVEGMFLLALTVLGLRRVARVPREAIRTGYVAFCLVYTLAFVYAFSAIGNFGILTRQRVQVLPFFLVLLCLPKTAPTDDAPAAAPALARARA